MTPHLLSRTNSLEAERRAYGWPAGRADLHWHVLFDPAVVQERLVVPYREITHRAGVAPVEARWVHATVMHGGPVERYEAGEIGAITERVRQEAADIEPFDLVLDRPTISRLGVECTARAGAPARRLWELTTRIDAEVTGARFPTIPSVYYPHLSLAYGVAGEERADRRAMKAAMPDLDPPGEPVVLRAERMSLVAQSHDRQFITWNHLADVPLHGGR
ncbi:2'-5' RNA ligase family protein [Streptomyces sp. NBC_01317]|uniref:2'-5' RNA ligase family protein n=1 Tax=Streptomyces sp. NBC_01317 TaxID=2903822 RepID=UPI002E1286AF|nr:2'-5' RNA ligase family protein [Streptomyces sp. NBC_01317]